MTVKALEWAGDHLRMLDQRVLPQQEVWLELRSSEEVANAIRDMAVRGAPAIGVAAAYGMAIAARRDEDLHEAARALASSRPTAVNLFWALDRIAALPDKSAESVLAEARAIELEDLQMNLAIGHHGAKLLPDKVTVLTICNTGSLATAGHGTALGVIRTCSHEGKDVFVYACETRPRQQGLKLTAYELMAEGIPFAVIADGAAASLMRAGKIDAVIAGADRIAANGDTANKIGTYSLAVSARFHGIPFYIAAPSSTLDKSIATGAEIPIEERSATELTHVGFPHPPTPSPRHDGIRGEGEPGVGEPIAPEGTPVFNPAFDVTPGELIDAIVTEEGVFRPPFDFMSRA